jgi:hypothetical protein
LETVARIWDITQCAVARDFGVDLAPALQTGANDAGSQAAQIRKRAAAQAGSHFDAERTSTHE